MSNLFDRFAKGVAEGVSRRDALKYLGGFLGGGFLTALAGKAGAIGCNTPIPAECTTYCATCPTSPRGVQNRCLQSCKLFYLLTGSVTTCAACSAMQPFSGCPTSLTGFTCCPATNGYCTNTNYDPNNCGTCGTVCSTGTIPGCCSGACVDLDVSGNCGFCGNTCSATQACCSGRCVDLQTNRRNCGTCGTACSSGQTCVAGGCTTASSPPPPTSAG